MKITVQKTVCLSSLVVLNLNLLIFFYSVRLCLLLFMDHAVNSLETVNFANVLNETIIIVPLYVIDFARGKKENQTENETNKNTKKYIKKYNVFFCMQNGWIAMMCFRAIDWVSLYIATFINADERKEEKRDREAPSAYGVRCIKTFN